MLIFTFMVLALLACDSFFEPVTPLTGSTETPLPVYAAVQSTLASGQSEMTELSRKATEVSANMAQAAATQQFISQQTQMGWDATAIVQSQNATITAQSQDATATSQSQDATTIAQNQDATAIAQNQDATAIAQNQNATATAQSHDATAIAQNQDATAIAQSQDTTATAQSQDATATAQVMDATATEAAYIRNVTQTVQAQVMLDIQATRTDLENATLAAYSLTATPWAAIQAEIVRTRNTSERRAWWEEYITTPLKVILLILLVLLLVVGGVMVYRRLMPVLELRLRTISRENDSPLILEDGKIVEPDSPHRQLTRWVLQQPNLPQFPSYETPQVEIIDPSDPSVAFWISETEQKLSNDGRIQL